MQFPGVHAGKLLSVVVSDLATQNVAYRVVFFSSVPTDIADNAANDFADADLPNILGVIDLATGDRYAFVDNSASVENNINMGLKSDEADGDIWVFVYTTGTPTYVTASDISVTILVEQL